MNRKTKIFRSPYLFFGLLALIITLLFTYYFTRWNIGSLFAYLLGINLAVLLLYAYDKLVAGGSLLRVPEIVLHALAIAGGSPIALVAQKILRHKTVKKSFQRVYWVIVVLQIGLLFGYLIR